jgi:hypothetical protein
MKTLKTLNQAFLLSSNNSQITAETILNGNLYTSKGWEKFNVSHDLLKSTALLIAETLGGWQSTKNSVERSLSYGSVSHWGLRRLIFSKRKQNDKRKNTISLSYCAGQDYVYELNQIRTDLK